MDYSGRDDEVYDGSSYSSGTWNPASYAGSPTRSIYAAQPNSQSVPYGYSTAPRSEYAAPLPPSSGHGSVQDYHHNTQYSQYYSQAAPSSASSPSSYAPQGSTFVSGHDYRRLPSTDKAAVDRCLEQVRVDDKRAYRCLWPNCSKEPFKSKDNARVHVHKHLGTTKLFECMSCPQQFASEDAAKRHRDTTQSRAFPCAYCFQNFARKDYRDLHQRKCPARPA